MNISPEKTRIGWIGTGVMGRSMCGHLLDAGYACTVFNRTKNKADDLVARGATWAGSPRAVAEQSDVVFSIPDLGAVQIKGGKVEGFQNSWDMVLKGMKKKPDDDTIEHLYF